MKTATQAVGDVLRDWRQRRRLSQLELATDANISARHLSFFETGRSRPSRDMVLHLAEALDMPLRERNALLVAAGFAPVFGERKLDDPALTQARQAIDLVLKGHEPYPALAVDRHWSLVAANSAVGRLIADAAASLLQPPVTVLRLSLHPDGLAPRIANLAEWRWHLLSRLRRQIDLTADRVLIALLSELMDLPAPRGARGADHGDAYGGVVVPLQLVTGSGTLSFFSTTTVFGTPVDITLAELAIEAFYPADAATGDALRNLSRA